MSRALIICDSAARREQAAAWALKAPIGTRIEFKEAKRSTEQNDRMWAMLTDIARQLTHHGERYDAEEWKLLFLDALNRECRVAPSLEGSGLVNLRRSSDLSKAEMSDMIEIIAAWGAKHGVKFGDDE
jgi:hypothetical protein